MFISVSLATVMDKKFLAFQVTEYQADAYASKAFVTGLSVIAFKASEGMSAANCTFNWTSVVIGANIAKTYISYCHDKTTVTGITYTNGTTADVVLKDSTATFAKFQAFDAVNIYYNNTLYYSINATNAASVGFTPSTYFAGKTADFDTNSPTIFSTVDVKLYIAQF